LAKVTVIARYEPLHSRAAHASPAHVALSSPRTNQTPEAHVARRAARFTIKSRAAHARAILQTLAMTQTWVQRPTFALQRADRPSEAEVAGACAVVVALAPAAARHSK
jgi:hypothetical protein